MYSNTVISKRKGKKSEDLDTLDSEVDLNFSVV